MEDTDFTVGHGFRCLLPDFRLFVEPTAYGWEALIYEEPVRKYREPIHKQFLDGSSNGKNECKLFVNTWRAAENSGLHKPLTAELQWEEYSSPRRCSVLTETLFEEEESRMAKGNSEVLQ
jgi:hypothetical protein